MDSKSTQLLWDLRVAIVKALAEDGDTRDLLTRIREEGWSTYLVIDARPPGSDAANGMDGDEDQLGEGLGADDVETLPLATKQTSAVPEFKINCDDLSLLRSLGIDPTRKLRNRRRA